MIAAATTIASGKPQRLERTSRQTDNSRGNMSNAFEL
jgi:hypothetical protein